MDPEHQRRFVNLNAFLAQLTQAADFEYHFEQPGGPAIYFARCPLDESAMMIRAMQFAFEDGFEIIRTDPRVFLTEEAAGIAALWAACEWFIHAADRLWANVENKLIWKDPSESSVGPGAAFAAKGWKGFERERWDVWEQFLRALEWACEPEKHENTRRRLRDALAQMQRARKGGASAADSRFNEDAHQAHICLQHRRRPTYCRACGGVEPRYRYPGKSSFMD